MPRSKKPTVWIETRKAKGGFKTYRVRAEKDGVRLRDIACGPDRKDAEKVRARLEHDLWSGRLGTREPSDVSVFKWRDEYLKVCHEQHELSTYLSFDKPAVEGFAAFAGDRLLRSVDLDLVLAWKAHLFEQGWKKKSGKTVPLGPTTVRMRLAHARAGFSWAKRPGRAWITENPFEQVEMPRPIKRDRVLTPDELKIAYEILPAEHARWFTVLLWTGLRKEELIRLTGSHVVKARHEGELWRLVFKADETKNHKPKAVELHPRAQAAVEESLKLSSNDTLFDDLTDKKVRFWFARLSQRIGRTTPHMIKHTFCTRFMEATGDIDSLALMTGNSRRSLELHYIHLSRARPRAVLHMDFGFSPPILPPNREMAGSTSQTITQ